MSRQAAETSRAVVTRDLQSLNGLRIEERAIAAPGPGQVRIAVRASGVSFVDSLIASGNYQVRPDVPFTPGAEFSGVIDAVGDGVGREVVGRRVCASALGGGFSDHATVPASAAIAIPDAMGFEEAAIFRVSFATAYYALVQRANISAGERVLVLGAGGGVGAACVEVAAALGARVVGSASIPQKRAIARDCGAEAVVDCNSADWREQLDALTGGRGFDIIVDPIGGAASEPAFRAIAWGGRFLVIGFASGAVARFPTNLALLKGASIVGVDIRQFGERRPDIARSNLDRIFEMYACGAVRPRVGAIYGLADFAAAMTAATDRNHVGRVVIRIGSDDR